MIITMMAMVMVMETLMFRQQPWQSPHRGRRNRFPSSGGERSVATEVAQGPGAPWAEGAARAGSGRLATRLPAGRGEGRHFQSLWS